MKRILAAIGLVALYCLWRGGHGKQRQIAGPQMGRVTCPECGQPQDIPSAKRFLRGAVQAGEGDVVARIRRAGA